MTTVDRWAWTFRDPTVAWTNRRPFEGNQVAELRVQCDAPGKNLVGEFAIGFYDLGMQTAARIEVFDDAMAALDSTDLLSRLAKVSAKVGSGSVTPEMVVKVLEDMGMVDMTAQEAARNRRRR